MLHFISKYLKQNRLKFICYLFCIVLTSIISTCTPLLLSNIINSVIYEKNFKFFSCLCIIFFLLLLISLCFSCLERTFFYELQIKIVGKICSDVIEHLQKVSFSVLKNRDFVALTQKLNNDAVNVVFFLLNNIGSVVVHIIELIIILFILCKLSFIITLLVLINGFLYIIIYNISKDKLYTKQYSTKEAQAGYFSKLHDQFKFFKYVKTHVLFTFFNNRLDDELCQLYQKTISLTNFQNILNFFQGIVDITIQILCYLCAGYKIIHGDMMVGLFVLISSYISIAKQAIVYFGSLGQQFQNQKVSYSRIKDLLALPEEVIGNITINKISSIKINNLSFSFGKDTIINNLKFTLSQGNIYGIVGENGAGKSTLMDILIGLYLNQYKGEILYNGTEISNIDLYFVRKNKIGMAEQSPILLEDDLITNLGFGEEIDQGKSIEYLRNFNLQYLISKSGELKLENSPTLLSGGEKQKLGIIRELLKNSDVMIFDEPTSALDTESRLYLKEVLTKIKKEKIILIITHDEDILGICDSILKISRRI